MIGVPEMLIDKLTVRSFKSIVDQEIELGQFNVFIGANGSGKSNLLEALGVLSAAAFGRVDDESLLRRGVRPGVPRLYKNSFAGLRTPPHIYFEAQGGEARYAVSLNNPLENPRSAWQYKTESLEFKRKKVAGRGPHKNNFTFSAADSLHNEKNDEKRNQLSKEEKQLRTEKINAILKDFNQLIIPSNPDITKEELKNLLFNRLFEDMGMEPDDWPVVNNKEQGIVPLILATLPSEHPVTQLIDTLRTYAVYAPNTPTLRGMISDLQMREPVGLSGGGLADAVQALQHLAEKDQDIQDLLDDVLELIDWASGFDTSTSAQSLLSASVPRHKHLLRFRDRYMPARHSQLTAFDASEGALYVLFNAVLALSPKAPPCLAIDNLDQALNPRLAKALIKTLCRLVLAQPVPRQLLMTVHNPAALDGLPLLDDRVRLFAVDRNSAGHTGFRRIQISEELKARYQQEGLSLSRMWVMGHLGGVPDV